jgi:transposase InsO family protein
MGLSRATYYHKTRREQDQLDRDFELKEMIEKIHLELPGYGYRRIREHLIREGIYVNSKRIRRVMRKYSLFSCIRKLMGQRGKLLGKRLVFPNLIQGKLLSGPKQLWSTDITYIKLAKEYVYLSAIMDVYTRKIVGWAVSRDLSHAFCLEALKVAIRRENPPRGVIHHSDRGVQYTSEIYTDFLKEKGFEISMSAVGTPEDNAYIESFFKTLKKEEIYFKDYMTLKDVVANLPKFLDEVYNRKRLHSSLGYRTPVEYEAEVLKLKPADRPVQKLWGRAV